MKIDSFKRLRLRNFILAFFFLLILLFIIIKESRSIYEYRAQKNIKDTANFIYDNKDKNFIDLVDYAATRDCNFILYEDGSIELSYTNNNSIIQNISYLKIAEILNIYGKNEEIINLYSDGSTVSNQNNLLNDKLSYIAIVARNNMVCVTETTVRDMPFFIANNITIFLIISLVTIVFTIIITEGIIYNKKKRLQKYLTYLDEVTADPDTKYQNMNYYEYDQINEKLEKLIDENRKTSIYQKELIANVSHDLRTPLTMLNGYTEMMLDMDGELNKENVKIVHDESIRLTTLVNDLLDLSKINSNRLELNKEYFSITNNIQMVIKRINKMNELKGFNIVFSYDNNYEIFADKSKIDQVVYNFIINAINYTGQDKKIFIGQRVTKKGLLIEFKDTGEGISKENIQKIFNRYYTTGENHNRSLGGSGLGLNIAKQILDLHDYEFGVSSSSKGSNFYFYIPNYKKIHD